jgi:hypothetical protein
MEQQTKRKRLILILKYLNKSIFQVQKIAISIIERKNQRKGSDSRADWLITLTYVFNKNAKGKRRNKLIYYNENTQLSAGL